MIRQYIICDLCKNKIPEIENETALLEGKTPLIYQVLIKPIYVFPTGGLISNIHLCRKCMNKLFEDKKDIFFEEEQEEVDAYD